MTVTNDIYRVVFALKDSQFLDARDWSWHNSNRILSYNLIKEGLIMYMEKPTYLALCEYLEKNKK